VHKRDAARLGQCTALRGHAPCAGYTGAGTDPVTGSDLATTSPRTEKEQVAKHRRASAPPPPPGPRRPVRELLLWSAFACALVPPVLLWGGAGWEAALAAGGLLLLLAVLAAVALRMSGIPAPAPVVEDDDPPAP
jgi:hypothetical protein